MPTLICDCNKTMHLDPRSLGAALNEPLTLHSTLCRREAGAVVHALQSGAEVLIACTQEQPLFLELASQLSGAAASLRFVNIRETAGWSREARQAGPKIAALLAAAQRPAPEPVATVAYQSAGRLLVVGELGAAERAAALLGDELEITLFSPGAGAQEGGPQERRYPVLAGQVQALTGWLGAFELQWRRSNPLDLDRCTRCNACLAACPEGAIGLDYQIDLALCRSHRACIRACQGAAAIDFSRPPEMLRETFDLVLDLRATPAFPQHALPPGYLRWNGRDVPPLLQLRALVGEFEKPRFVAYQQKKCAHSRHQKTGCQACIEVCSASAIRSEPDQQQISVNPHLCAGCGVCSTVCPSGALRYAYPQASEMGQTIRTLLRTYAGCGGQAAALLLHSADGGARLLNDLGRAAQLQAATHGLPARVLPLALRHSASLGLEVWLAAVAYGASQVWVLMTGEEAPHYPEAIRRQMAVAQAILTGLGYPGEHFRLLQARDARELDALDQDLQAAPGQCVSRPADFAVQADKRATLELALAHLVACAPVRPALIALPAAGSPLGALALDKERCTLCLSCINACPAGALQDNPQLPQLNFIEKNCLQCGLCVSTCPEKALALLPQLNLTPQRHAAVVLNEMTPYACVRCRQPFGTYKAIEAMLERLAGHSLFQGAARERLKMCGDCRVIDLYSALNETRITEL